MATPVEKCAANTFIIGAQKSGTTLLAGLLATHPEICVSVPKEPQYYTTNFDKGEEFYRSCFLRPDAKIRLDASTTYSFLRPKRDLDVPNAPGLLSPVPQRIYRACPEARFIYILRDPVARARSAFLHLMRNTSQSSQEVSLLECLDQNPMLELISRYSDQIEHYFDYFSIDHFLFLDFRDIIRDPIAVAQRTCDFLSVDRDGIRDIDTTNLKHSAHQATAIVKIYHWLKKVAPKTTITVRSCIPKHYAARIGKREFDVVFRDEEAVAERFRAEYERIRLLTGIEF